MRWTAILQPNPVKQLSARQLEIADLVVAGKTNPEIARALALSDRTIETHVAGIFNKLGVHSRVELVRSLLRTASVDRAETSARKTNLPYRLPPLIGRDKALAELSESLHGSRLVSLVGPGGVGKTQMALRLGAAQLEREFEVWFVDLSTASGPSFVAPVVAGTLRVSDMGTRPLADAIVASLGRRKLLLIVDNCEHVVHAGAELVRTLLDGTPEVQIVTTSREPLRVAGESIYSVAPLAEADAHALFAQRAKAVSSQFERNARSEVAIARICRAVDCLPLAIEFAAARSNLLSVEALADRLEQRLRILTAGDRTAAPRHQTLEALIDWSYELLSPDERRLFEYLSIFSGGASLTAVLDVGTGEERSEDELLVLLGSLVDKSLAFTDLGDGEPRYHLLETTRAYARAKLVARGALDDAARRHAEVYTNVAEEMEQSWSAGADRAWIARAAAELPNIRAALVWTLQEGHAAVLGRRLAAASRYAWINFACVEGRRWVQLALAKIDRSTPDDILARLTLSEAQFAAGVSEFEESLAASLRARTLFRRGHDRLGLARAAANAGRLMTSCNREEEAEPLLEEALSIARSLGMRALMGFVLEGLGRTRAARGDIAEVRSFFGEAIALYRAVGAERTAATTMVQLAEAEYRAGNPEAALDTVRLALDESRELAQPVLVAGGLANNSIAEGLANMSAYLVALNRFAEAHASAREALDAARALEHNMIAWPIQHLVAIAALGPRPDPSRAARLCGFVDAHLAKRGIVRRYTEDREYERLRQRLCLDLDAEALRLEMANGATWNEERAIFEALLVEA